MIKIFLKNLNLKSPQFWLATLIALLLSLLIIISLTIITNIVISQLPINAWLIGTLFLLIILGSLTYQILFNVLNVNWNRKTDLIVFNILFIICAINHLTIDLILIIEIMINGLQNYYLITIAILGLMLNLFAMTEWIKITRRCIRYIRRYEELF